MSTKRKLGLPVIGLALVAIVGVVGGLAFSGASSSPGDTSQPSPPKGALEVGIRFYCSRSFARWPGRSLCHAGRRARL